MELSVARNRSTAVGQARERRTRVARTPAATPTVHTGTSTRLGTHAAAPCSCGGGCPRCRKQQANKPPALPISKPTDAGERDADRLADTWLSSSTAVARPALAATEPGAQRKASGGAATPAADRAASATPRSSGGQPLGADTRAFFEARSGADLGAVRVHTDAYAAASAAALGADAFTVGHDIVFGARQYQPESPSGRRLLAHELAHVLQQRDGRPRIQRRLSVNPNHPSFAPASDPAASLTSAQRFAMMSTIISALCPEFEVDAASGEVLTVSRTSLPPDELAAGLNPVGCCCLDVLTMAPNDWTIEVSQVVGPRTLGGSRQVVLSPTTTPIEFGSFTAAGNLAFQGQVPAAGHELCGHAALMEVGAHPPPQDRTRTDVHDPTVNIENAISTEQGVPAADLRGLAASSTHRGESVDRITINGYPLNGTAVSTLPVAERDKLQFAADYATTNGGFVDILGHSDSAGSASAKLSVSQQRADRARDHLLALGLSTTTTPPGFVSATNRFTRVEGVSDTQPPPPPLNANQANWRRVELLIAGFPAGAQTPPSGTPTAVLPHVRAAGLPAAQASANACVSLLANSAYP